MSFPLVKWALRSLDDPLAPPLSAEKWKCLVLLAWRAHDDGRFPDEDGDAFTPAVLAKWAHVAEAVAGRYIRELRAEGPLRDTGERTGYRNRTPIYAFAAEWAPDARTIALAREAQKQEGRGSVKRDAKYKINPANPDANSMFNEGLNMHFASDAKYRINDPSIYGVNVNQTNKRPNCDSRVEINAVAPAGEASPPAAPVATGVEVNVDHRSNGATSRSGSAQAEPDARAAAATASEPPPPSETSNPRAGKKRAAKKARVDERTSRSVIAAHLHRPEVVPPAQRLEAIFERYLDKPAYTATSYRFKMGEWLVSVAVRKVDEAMFEAACRDTKRRANGRSPTWKDVKTTLDARIKARESDTQPVEDVKDFFEQPARKAGTYAVPGNETVH